MLRTGFMSLGAVLLLLLQATQAQEHHHLTCNLHPALHRRILEDVSIFALAGGITDGTIRNMSRVCNYKDNGLGADPKNKQDPNCNVAFGRFLIENGRVYLTSIVPKKRIGPEHFGVLMEIFEASKRHRLSDIESAMFVEDGSLDLTDLMYDDHGMWTGRMRFPHGVVPIMGWSKSRTSGTLIVPYSSAFRCPHDSFDAIEDKLDEIMQTTWEDRQPIAFGRWNLFCAPYYGGDNAPRMTNGELYPGCPREYLPKLAKNHTDIMDVATLTEKEGVPLAQQNKFRYLVSTDGWAISSKFDKYLLLGSLILRAASPQIGFYYDALREWEHYVPIMKDNATDILNMIEWAKTHEQEAQRIARAAQTFAVQHLNREARLCYYATLTYELAKHFRYKPTCTNRKTCIPLAHVMRFYSEWPHFKDRCKYQDLLLRYASSPEDMEGYDYNALLRMYEDDDVFSDDAIRPELETAAGSG